MSHVTDVLLLYSGAGWDDEERAVLDKVNAYFRPPVGLQLIPSAAFGGSKVIQSEVLGGAFNYLDIAAFVAHLKAIDWRALEVGWAQAVIKDEHDEGYALLDIYREPDGDPPANPAHWDHE